MAKRKVKVKERQSTTFLPHCLDQVKAIAMRGLTDSEMAAVFGIKPELIQRWKEFYPDFEKAIEEGRTHADAKVVEALYLKATGYYHPDTKVHWDKHGDAQTLEVMKHYPPSDKAIEMWLTNRQKEHWKNQQHHSVGGSKDQPLDIGVRDETKKELMSSILSLITPKSDGD